MGKMGEPWRRLVETGVPPWAELAAAVSLAILFGLLWLSFLVGVYRFFTRRPPD